MIITIFVDNGYTFSENTCLSIILGYHCQDMDDFEFTIPVTAPNIQLSQKALYATAMIQGEKYIILKVEYVESENEHFIRFTGKHYYAYILKCSLAKSDIHYSSEPHNTVKNLIERAIDYYGVTDKKAFKIKRIENNLNFNILKEKSFILDWLYGECKQNGCLCRFDGPEISITYPNQSFITNRYISYKKTKEKINACVWLLLNGFFYKVDNENITNSWAEPKIYESSALPAYPVNESKDSLDYMLKSYFDAFSGSSTTKVNFGVKITEDPYSNTKDGTTRYFYVLYGSNYGDRGVETPEGVTLKVKNIDNKDILRGIFNSFRNYYVIEWELYSNGKAIVTENIYPIQKLDNNTYYMPEIKHPNEYKVEGATTKIYFNGIVIDRQTKAQVPPWSPSTYSLLPPFDLLQAYNQVPYRLFPADVWKHEFELSEEEYKNIPLGSKVLVFPDCDPSVVCTDKVISYENGEVHYDATLGPIVKLAKSNIKRDTETP